MNDLEMITRRWLPAPTLRDLDVHLAASGTTTAVCGTPIMWAAPGHPSTLRPRCDDCVRKSRR
ncbi:hypothetical protein [Saccharopolyspora flava]|uniref:hypothetical protein n=1 Tax=Saccharopolyspora flava TaxID=95161 RepID=UPI000B84388D|nr:hypothetical protein [Saccharopolyspora flava]